MFGCRRVLGAVTINPDTGPSSDEGGVICRELPDAELALVADSSAGREAEVDREEGLSWVSVTCRLGGESSADA